jgi:hypothetical protein
MYLCQSITKETTLDILVGQRVAEIKKQLIFVTSNKLEEQVALHSNKGRPSLLEWTNGYFLFFFLFLHLLVESFLSFFLLLHNSVCPMVVGAHC